MKTPRISLIAALSKQTRAIGKDNGLLWRLPGDLPRFKELTMGHPIIMGSTTYASIGNPLPGRTNIVITNDAAFTADGVLVCHSINEALASGRMHDGEELFIIGGGSIYAQTLEHADRLYLTLVDDERDGDVYFPRYEHLPFTEISREEHLQETPPFMYITLDRTDE